MAKRRTIKKTRTTYPSCANKKLLTKKEIALQKTEFPHNSRSIPAITFPSFSSIMLSSINNGLTSLKATMQNITAIFIKTFFSFSISKPYLALFFTTVTIVYFLLITMQVRSSLQKLYHEAQMKQMQANQLKNEARKWQQATIIYPNYRDAYLQLTLLYYQLGDMKQAKQNAEKVFELDPNYQANDVLKMIMERK